MDNSMIPKGMEIVKEAVAADNANDLDKALVLYKQALKHFVAGLKYVKNERSKAAIREKVEEYMKRAEAIRVEIESRNNAPTKSAQVVGASGKVGEDGKDQKGEEEDKETAKLEASIANAIVAEKPNVKWDDVAGLDNAKSLLKEAVILPVKYPQLFTGNRKPWAGILLYGPPGTGKSYLAKAVATESGASCFLSVSSSDLVSKFQGESERLVKALFEVARKKAPSIIFIDEIDSLCGSRSEGENDSARRIKTEFLVQMQGVGKGNKGVLVLGATNTPWELDPAIRRRFEKRVYIPLPEERARAHMFKIHVGSTPHSLRESDFTALARRTEGFSGSDIGVAVRDALYEPIRTLQVATHFKKVPDPERKHPYLLTPCSAGDKQAQEMSLFDIPSELLKPEEISLRHFETVLRTVKPSVAPEDLTRQEEWTQQFGQEGS